MKKIALIVFSHGSVLPEAGQLMDKHVQRLRETGDFACVEAGYLNYSLPPIETAVAVVMKAQPDVVVVVPYFLVSGKFVREDLRPRFDSVAACYPDTQFILTPPLEDLAVMERVVLELLPHAIPLTAWETEPTHAPPPQPAPLRPRTAVLLVLHGSPYEEANAPARAMANQMTQHGVADLVLATYLDCAEPTIAAAVEECVQRGFHQMVAVPWFLHMGKHIRKDLPRLFHQAVARHPGATLAVTPPAGVADAMAEVVRTRALQAVAQMTGA